MRRILATAIALLAIAAPAQATTVGLPNSVTTPGATNPAVSQGNIRSTICVSGFTATIRPPASYTNALKAKQLKAGLGVAGYTKSSQYEEDHLISLEIGGAPRDPKNLWPEPRFGTASASRKDTLENKLHALVCSGKLTLIAAQHAIATNWEIAYRTYIGPLSVGTEAPATEPTTSASATSTPTPSSASTSSSLVTPGAYCSNAGETGVSAKGTTYTCKISSTDDRLRWRV